MDAGRCIDNVSGRLRALILKSMDGDIASLSLEKIKQNFFVVSTFRQRIPMSSIMQLQVT